MQKLFLLLCLSSFAMGLTPTQIAAEIEGAVLSDTADMPKTKAAIDAGMNRALEKAEEELSARGRDDLATQIRNEWTIQYENSLFATSRDIGDHAGIFPWVEKTYREIELVLGRDFCVSSHIAAMLTFNSANVVVHPCTFPMDAVTGTRIDEYRRHFAGRSVVSDSNYNGVMPEACYFAAEIACMAATSGVGSFACSFVANAGEKLMATFVAPNLSDRIFTRRCLNQELGDFYNDSDNSSYTGSASSYPERDFRRPTDNKHN